MVRWERKASYRWHTWMLSGSDYSFMKLWSEMTFCSLQNASSTCLTCSLPMMARTMLDTCHCFQCWLQILTRHILEHLTCWNREPSVWLATWCLDATQMLSKQWRRHSWSIPNPMEEQVVLAYLVLFGIMQLTRDGCSLPMKDHNI